MTPKPVILFSDGCGYENRNVVLSNVLCRLSTKYNVTIEHQKYLERSHHQMACDSAHSLIERRKTKGRDIFLPTDYIYIVKVARPNLKPLDVKYLDHTYFSIMNMLIWQDVVQFGLMHR